MTTASPTPLDRRTTHLAKALEDAGVDQLLVTGLINVRYLTGYTGSNGLALIGSDRRVFLTDFRYVEQAAEEVDPSFERIETSAAVDLIGAVADVVGAGPLKLGFDDVDVTVAAFRRLEDSLGDGIELTPAGGLVEKLRRSKGAEEIEAIAAAQRIADAAFEALLAEPIVGRTERELALALEHEMRVRGASEPSFGSIVAAGPHGALPHAQPRDVPVQVGQLLTIDWGARAGGYCSDCTRTLSTGEISTAAGRAYEAVLAAQLAGVDAVRAGADCHGVDAVARDLLTEAGYGDVFGHGLGHGVGLEVHEGPYLSRRIPAGSDQLAVDDVVTVEPGVYLPGQFGIRIEDLCVVTEGAPRILTPLPKELRVVE